jgi:hypothetical protein
MEIENGITAYHGSPYLFDRFTNRFGHGVGGNALGHGIYFSEINKSALSYGRIAADYKFKRKLINRLLFKKSAGTEYYLYTVKLLVDPQKLLDLSIPLQDQSEVVRRALGAIKQETGIDFSQPSKIDHPQYPSWKIVNQLRLHLKGATLASNMLSKHGIQGSKLKVDDFETQYIIFDPQHAQIINTEHYKL